MSDATGGLLRDKVIVITGAGDGMGRTAALRFAAEGAAIVGCDVNATAAAETVEMVTAAGGVMESLYPLDLTDEHETHRLMDHAATRFGGIDVLYSNAMAMRLGAPSQMRADDWRFSLEHTLTSGWLAAKHATPHLRRRGGGDIVFISSVAGEDLSTGFVGNLPILGSYAVAKAGLSRLATVLAIELAEHDIRVNTISPAWIDVPATSRVYGAEGSPPHRAITTQMLAGRLGTPEDVVETALFLLSGKARFIVGANVRVDGGQFAGGGHGRPSAEIAALFAPTAGEWLSVDDQWTTAPDGVGASELGPSVT